MPTDLRSPPKWLRRWRRIFFRLDMSIHAFQMAAMRMVALDRRASLRDSLVRQFAVNTHHIMASWTTPGIHAAQESCQPATYSEEPGDCSHSHGLRKYGARGGTYQICDRCGQRWIRKDALWNKLEPRPGPKQHNKPQQAKSTTSSARSPSTSKRPPRAGPTASASPSQAPASARPRASTMDVDDDNMMAAMAASLNPQPTAHYVYGSSDEEDPVRARPSL